MTNPRLPHLIADGMIISPSTSECMLQPLRVSKLALEADKCRLYRSAAPAANGAPCGGARPLRSPRRSRARPRGPASSAAKPASEAAALPARRVGARGSCSGLNSEMGHLSGSLLRLGYGDGSRAVSIMASGTGSRTGVSG